LLLLLLLLLVKCTFHVTAHRTPAAIARDKWQLSNILDYLTLRQFSDSVFMNFASTKNWRWRIREAVSIILKQPNKGLYLCVAYNCLTRGCVCARV